MQANSNGQASFTSATIIEATKTTCAQFIIYYGETYNGQSQLTKSDYTSSFCFDNDKSV